MKTTLFETWQCMGLPGLPFDEPVVEAPPPPLTREERYAAAVAQSERVYPTTATATAPAPKKRRRGRYVECDAVGGVPGGHRKVVECRLTRRPEYGQHIITRVRTIDGDSVWVADEEWKRPGPLVPMRTDDGTLIMDRPGYKPGDPTHIRHENVAAWNC